MERRLKEALAARAGMREIVTYPWVSTSQLEACGLADLPTIGLAHPPSPDLRLAPSLVLQMLATVVANLRFLDAFDVFELRRVFTTTLEGAGPGALDALPQQPRKLAAAFVGADSGELFYRAKGVLERLPRVVQFEAFTFDRGGDAPWGDPGARLGLSVGGRAIGVLAVVSARTKGKVGIRGAEVALFELDVDQLTPFPSRHNAPVDVPSVPQVDFDINVMVERGVEWASIREVAGVADLLVRDVSFVDEYVGPQVSEGHKSVTLRLRLGADEGTLVREQIDDAAGRVMAALQQRLGGVIRH